MMKKGSEPRCELRLDGVDLTLLGTAHLSQVSADQVRQLIQSGEYDSVAIESCWSRYKAMMEPRVLAQMDLFAVIRENRVYMVMASLALSAYQQRLADQFGIEPGAEQRMALRLANAQGLHLMLIDREIGITLKRVSASLGWWQRVSLFASLLASLMSKDQVAEDEIERLKESDILESIFAEFAANRRDLYVPLIEERDRYMAAKLKREIARVGAKRVLVVIGAGHLQGVKRALQETQDDPEAIIQALEGVPPARRWPVALAWGLAALIGAGFAYGFSLSPALGLNLLTSWAIITGGLAALGTVLAGGHPLTTLAAFVSAPLTTLNPTIGVGMVTGAVELYLRTPRVGDFNRLRSEVTHWHGWWRNRIARVFLVFAFSSLGAALGTYIASLHLIEHLLQA